MPGDTVINMPTTEIRPNMVTFDMDSDHGSSKQAGITRLTVDIPSSRRTPRPEERRSTPRWRTPEFAFYYVAFGLVVPLMVWIPVQLSYGEFKSTVSIKSIELMC